MKTAWKAIKATARAVRSLARAINDGQRLHDRVDMYGRIAPARTRRTR